MKTKILFALILIALQITAFGQEKLITKTGHIWFYSKMPMETIEAHNKQVVGVLDPATGEVVFNMLIKSFSFERALMEEHFNENYMESSKLPKSTFKGKVANIKSVKFGTNGTYKSTVEGELTIHGITKTVNTPVSFVVNGRNVKAVAKFKVMPEDYGIKIPSVVADKISKQFDVNVDIDFKPNK